MKEVKNVEASIRARLLNLAKRTGRDFDALLLQYCQERFLYRLSISPYKADFVLKGALLLLAYNIPLLRPTKDIDFLAKGTSNDPEAIREIIERVATIEGHDGISFSKANIRVERIMEGTAYAGLRVKIQAKLREARKVIQLDIAYGDVVPRKAILSTFRHRMTPLKNITVLFDKEFMASREKQFQWSAFLQRSRLESLPSFLEAMGHLRSFIEPVCSTGLGPQENKKIWKTGEWKWE